MKKTNGQALVEFVLILPIFLFLVFGAIDFGTIFYQKYQLQNELENIKTLIDENREIDLNRYLADKKLQIAYQKEDTYMIVTITKTIKITTPGLNFVLKNPYPVEESMTILHEKS